jgi:hypothetical protein
LGRNSAACIWSRSGGPSIGSIRFGFANVGVDNRQFFSGNFLAVAHADHYIDNELKNLPGVKVEYTFFGSSPLCCRPTKDHAAGVRRHPELT